jgi:hypothetical protein
MRADRQQDARGGALRCCSCKRAGHAAEAACACGLFAVCLPEKHVAAGGQSGHSSHECGCSPRVSVCGACWTCVLDVQVCALPSTLLNAASAPYEVPELSAGPGSALTSQRASSLCAPVAMFAWSSLLCASCSRRKACLLSTQTLTSAHHSTSAADPCSRQHSWHQCTTPAPVVSLALDSSLSTL